MRGHAELFDQLNLHGMAQAAVRRSKGRCEAFWGERAGDDDFLDYLGDQAPSLKSLRLIYCYDVSTERFAKAIEKFPLLEELELTSCPNVCGNNVLGVVGKAFPQLKRFRLNKHLFYNHEFSGCNKDEAVLGIVNMHELRSLQIFGNNLTNEGLKAILDNCQNLGSLDIRHCFNLHMDDTLRAKCAGIKTLKLPHDSTADYDFQVQSPVWPRPLNDSQSEDDLDDDDIGSGFDYGDLDSEDYDDYCDPSRYLNGVYEDELGEELRAMRALLN